MSTNTQTVESLLEEQGIPVLHLNNIKLLGGAEVKEATLSQLVHYFKSGILRPPPKTDETFYVSENYYVYVACYYVRASVFFDASGRPTFLKIFIDDQEDQLRLYCQIITSYENGKAVKFKESAREVSEIEAFNINVGW